MAPGPPDKLSNNRFFVLGDYIDNPSKKQRPNEFPDLPTPCNNNKNHPKYVLISSSDPKKQLSELSPFAIKKGVESISTEFTSITLLRDGNLLILTRNARVAEKFVKTKSLSNVCSISCKLHDTLNSVKGVIYAPCLINVPEQEIVQEMKEQGVTDVYKFTKPSDDGKSRIPTGKIIVTFDLYRLPTTVDVAWYKCKVEHYIPNPMRCKNCQKLGHTKNRCKGNATCPECSLPPHAPEKCTRIFCTNCSEAHSSADKNCPRYVQMKEVLKIKTKNYCSIAEARRKYRENNPIQTANQNNTYASISSDSPTKRKETHNNQKEKNVKSSTQNIILEKQTTTTINQLNETAPTTIKQKQPSAINETLKENNKLNKTTEKNETSKSTILTDKNNSTENNNSESNNNKLMSPISSLTQSLISDNIYFLPSVAEESLDDITMDLSTP